jgi:hypothetical protein
MEKNILQEYFQKNSLPLPKYETKRYGGVDHEPMFKSAVTLFFSDSTTTFESLYPSPTAKGAEMEVAKMAIPYLNTYSFPSNKKKSNVIVLVDIENQGVISTETLLKNYNSPNVHIFFGSNFPPCSKLCQYDCVFHYVESAITDASDVAIILFLATLPATSTVAILTRDHFGDILEEMSKIKFPHMPRGMVVKKFSSVEKLLETL